MYHCVDTGPWYYYEFYIERGTNESYYSNYEYINDCSIITTNQVGTKHPKMATETKKLKNGVSRNRSH